MKDHVNNFPLYFYVLTLLISLKYYYKYFDGILKYLPMILAYTLLNEFLGHILKYSGDFALFQNAPFGNAIIYNIYDLFYYGFFYYVFYRLSSKPKTKKYIKISSGLVFLSYVISFLFQNPLTMALYWSTALASAVLVSHVAIYLKETKQNPLCPGKKRHNLMFWIAVGLLLFHSIFPFLFLSGYLLPDIWKAYNFRFLLRIMIVLMNILFCIGFVISRKKAFE